MERMMSLVWHNSKVSRFFAWWSPPVQFIAIPYDPDAIRWAAATESPAEMDQNSKRPSKAGLFSPVRTDNGSDD